MKKLSREEMKNVMGGLNETAAGGRCKHVYWPCDAPEVTNDPYCKCWGGLSW